MSLQGSKSFPVSEGSLTDADTEPQAPLDDLQNTSLRRYRSQGMPEPMLRDSNSKTGPRTIDKAVTSLLETPRTVKRSRTIYSVRKSIDGNIPRRTSSMRLRALSNSLKPDRRASQHNRNSHNSQATDHLNEDTSVIQNSRKYTQSKDKRVQTPQRKSSSQSRLQRISSQSSASLNSPQTLHSFPPLTTSSSRWKFWQNFGSRRSSNLGTSPAINPPDIHSFNVSLPSSGQHNIEEEDAQEVIGLVSDDQGDIEEAKALKEVLARHEAFLKARTEKGEQTGRVASPSDTSSKRRLHASTVSFHEDEEDDLDKYGREDDGVSLSRIDRMSDTPTANGSLRLTKKPPRKDKTEHTHRFSPLLQRVSSRLSGRPVTVDRDETRRLLRSKDRGKRVHDSSEGSPGRVRVAVNVERWGETNVHVAVRPRDRIEWE